MSHFYQLNLLGFVLSNCYLLHRQYRRSDTKQDENGTTLLPAEPAPSLRDGAISKFKWDYFPAYAFAVAADWIQGPHIYAMYKYDKNLPERLVAALYATGFLSGAISASFSGQLADKYGRRSASLIYCGLYIVTCLSMLSNNIYILFLGRFAGGISTTLLFSVLDAWMISEYNSRGLSNSKLSLGTVFSYATTMSSMIAISMGVVGDVLEAVGGRIWPFMGGVICCILAAAWMVMRWAENKGVSESSTNPRSSITTALSIIISDRKVLALTVVTCVFESSMYLFVFFWSAALHSARASSANPGDEIEAVPFGIIFACFMCAMMAGSSLFNLAKPSLSGVTFILMTVLVVASGAFSTATLTHIEAVLFYAFVTIECSIGAYFPSMNLLKSEVIQDDIRGSIYSLMRLPLNVFVVITHSLAEEGDTHRNAVFLLLAALLLAASGVIRRVFEK